MADGGGGEEVSVGARAGAVVVGGGGDDALAAGSGRGAEGTAGAARGTDSLEVVETLLAEALLLRHDQHSAGGGDAADTGGGTEDGLASGAVRISSAVILNTVSVSVLRVSGLASADLMSERIESKDSVGAGIAVGAKSGEE